MSSDHIIQIPFRVHCMVQIVASLYCSLVKQFQILLRLGSYKIPGIPRPESKETKEKYFRKDTL